MCCAQCPDSHNVLLCAVFYAIFPQPMIDFKDLGEAECGARSGLRVQLAWRVMIMVFCSIRMTWQCLVLSNANGCTRGLGMFHASSSTACVVIP